MRLLKPVISTQKHWYVRTLVCAGTHVSRFSSLVYRKAKICDMLLSVHCVYDTSLQFTLTPDTHAYSDLKFCPTWLNNIQHYNVQQNTWTFWILVPFPEISSQFFICMFYHPLYNCFKYFPSAKRELLFSGSLRLCKFIAFSCRLNLIICLLRVKQLWMVGFICLELTSRWLNGQC